MKKIYAYYATIWKEKWKEGIDQRWLSNFVHATEDEDKKQKINMLYLLSKFMYFGNEELRQLLLSLYRDLFKYPIVSTIRKNNGHTTNITFINQEFQKELNSTRFLGVGNPSESGVHMLYYFRQECDLSKTFFINTSDIFKIEKVTEDKPDGTKRIYLNSELKDTTIKRYVFIDDFCGSGSQAKSYLKNLVDNIKFKEPTAQVCYYMLFGTTHGIKEVQSCGVFDDVKAVFSIDESFKAFSANSRIYSKVPDAIIDKTYSEGIAKIYGTPLFGNPLGYGDCQLLLGLFHNTPDNTLPIFWSTKNKWNPIFKRYNKIY